MNLKPAIPSQQKLTIIALVTSVGVLLLHGMTGWSLINMPSPLLKPIEKKVDTPIEITLVDLQEAPMPPKEITPPKPEVKPEPKPKPKPKKQSTPIKPRTEIKKETTTVKKTVQQTKQTTVAKPKPVNKPKPNQQKPKKPVVSPKSQTTVIATNDADAEAKRQADLEAKRKADAEAKRQADLEAKRKADAEAKRQADLEAKRKADADKKRQQDSNKTHSFTTGQARWKRRPRAKLPRSAERTMKKGQKVTVLLELLVDKQGKVTSAAVTKSSGIPAVDSAAVTAAKRSKLHPFTKNNVPVKGKVIVPLDFINDKKR